MNTIVTVLIFKKQVFGLFPTIIHTPVAFSLFSPPLCAHSLIREFKKSHHSLIDNNLALSETY